MPSSDSRYNDALGDICQHTINNDDWGEYWVFSDSRFALTAEFDDEPLLKFLCEMFHPFARDEKQPWRQFLDIFNQLLKIDGYEICEKSHISGRALYIWREIALDYIEISTPMAQASYKLELIGAGSYAQVFKYTDDFYKTEFVIKRAKKDLNSKELSRFKREFERMRELKSPYIVEVYCFNDKTNEYIMEYMDVTLEEYIKKNNSKITINHRKYIGRQIIKAFVYIHSKNILHRDISPKNILIKEYEDILLVKVSDFGLVKIPDSTLTTINAEFKGCFNDPSLIVEGFDNYDILHEIYALTRLLYYVMTGRTNTCKIDNNKLRYFVEKGLNSDKFKRFQNVQELAESFNDI